MQWKVRGSGDFVAQAHRQQALAVGKSPALLASTVQPAITCAIQPQFHSIHPSVAACLGICGLLGLVRAGNGSSVFLLALYGRCVGPGLGIYVLRFSPPVYQYAGQRSFYRRGAAILPQCLPPCNAWVSIPQSLLSAAFVRDAGNRKGSLGPRRYTGRVGLWYQRRSTKRVLG